VAQGDRRARPPDLGRAKRPRKKRLSLADEARGKPVKVADLLAYLIGEDTRHDDRARAGLVLLAEAVGDLRTAARAIEGLAETMRKG
jgi:hypothetical protein